MVRGSGGDLWWARLLKGMAFAKRMLPKTLEAMPDPAVNPKAWEELWANYPAQWRSMLKKLRRVAGEDPVFA